MDDETIIELFFARSEQAIAELDRKYGRTLRRISTGILSSVQDAEECVNDAYLGAWAAIPPARPRPLLAYLCKIVRNLSLKAYSRKTAQKRGSMYEVAMHEVEGILPGGVSAEAALDAKELARMIETYLDGLSPVNRVIFMRRYAVLDSYADIAVRVGLSEKNVSVRLTRIRAALKTHLEERGIHV